MHKAQWSNQQLARNKVREKSREDKIVALKRGGAGGPGWLFGGV